MHDLTDREIAALDTLERHATDPHPYLSTLARVKARELIERGATFTVAAGAAIDAGRRDLAARILTGLFEEAEEFGRVLDDVAAEFTDAEGEALEPGEVRP